MSPSRVEPCQRCTLVHGDVIGLVAFDFVLRIILAAMARVAFPREIVPVDLADQAADLSGFQVPLHVLGDPGMPAHDVSSFLDCAFNRRPARDRRRFHSRCARRV